MTSFFETYFYAVPWVVGYVTLIWLLSLALKDAGIMDIFWGLGFVLLGFVYYLETTGVEWRRQLLLALVSIWGVRLSLHIFLRNRGAGEDYRYRKWRDEARNAFWWRSYFKVFLLQGAILWIISSPLLVAQRSAVPQNLTFFDILGIAFWSVGFLFETVGDFQLARFKGIPENRRKVLDSGLWRYTRHPNYFGDAMVWWGYFFIACSTEHGFHAVSSPILMTWLLIKISGVAMLERNLKKTKPGYTEYLETTNAFFPWVPKKVRHD